MKNDLGKEHQKNKEMLAQINEAYDEPDSTEQAICKKVRRQHRRIVEGDSVEDELGKLLAQCDASAEVSAEDIAWLNCKPVGRELL